jgi:hypothetical protein
MIKIIKTPIKKSELLEMANEEFGDIVKAVVDVRQEIMVIGGELHADEEVLLSDQEESKREDTWGINLYPKKSGNDWIEFDSMVNIKPHFGNRSRDVESAAIRERIREIVKKLVVD